MSKFTLEFKHSDGYEKTIDLDIRLMSRPSKEDYQKMLDVIDTLADLQKTYLPVIKTDSKPLHNSGKDS